LPVKGYMDLNTTFGKGENTKTIKVRYFVVESPPSVSIYNVVIRWPALKDLKAVMSVADLTMEYPVGDGKVGVVEADLEMAKKCLEMCPYYVMQIRSSIFSILLFNVLFNMLFSFSTMNDTNVLLCVATIARPVMIIIFNVDQTRY
jgi:hypothetical protein